MTSEPPSVELEFLVTVAMAAGTFLLATLMRAGRLRSRFQWYLDPEMPLILRHLPFALFPFAVMFGACAVALGAVVFDVSPLPGIVLPAIAIAILAFVVGVVFVFKPPEWLKPAWLRNTERGQRRVPQETVSDVTRQHPKITRAMPLLIVVGAVAAYLAFDLPPAVAAGAGAAAVLAAAAQRRGSASGDHTGRSRG